MPAEFRGDRVLGTSFRLWAANLGAVGLLAIVLYSPLLLWGASGIGDRAIWLAASVAFLLDGVLCAAVSHAVESRLRGGPFAVAAALRAVRPRLGVVAGSTIVTVLTIGVASVPAIVAGSVFRPAGWVLLLLPIVAACLFSVAIPVSALERGGVAAALARSVDLTRGRRIGVFVVLLVVGLFGAVLDRILVFVSRLSHVAGAHLLAAFLLSTLAAVTTGVLYVELVGRDDA